jgi:tellurite methyltransferase
MRILDAGCASGRNVVYFLREGYDVYGVDADARAVERVRALARTLAPALPASNFRVEAVEHMSLDDACADVVISSAVLHFARDDAQFESMLLGSWRVLKPGGFFFCRLYF